jgi:hypothetical protein
VQENAIRRHLRKIVERLAQRATDATSVDIEITSQDCHDATVAELFAIDGEFAQIGQRVRERRGQLKVLLGERRSTFGSVGNDVDTNETRQLNEFRHDAEFSENLSIVAIVGDLADDRHCCRNQIDVVR